MRKITKKIMATTVKCRVYVIASDSLGTMQLTIFGYMARKKVEEAVSQQLGSDYRLISIISASTETVTMWMTEEDFYNHAQRSFDMLEDNEHNEEN